MAHPAVARYQEAPMPPPPLPPPAVKLFHKLWDRARRHDAIAEPDATNLATVDADGRPSARTVLLKGFDERGFVFYTNLRSRKGRALAADPRAALTWLWKPIDRQVRAEGDVVQVSDEEADAYFATRARGSQLGAWASEQSGVMKHRGELLQRAAEFTARFGVGEIPRPPHWSGFRLHPHRVEFWIARPYRLHVRREYIVLDGEWTRRRLFP